RRDRHRGSGEVLPRHGCAAFLGRHRHHRAAPVVEVAGGGHAQGARRLERGFGLHGGNATHISTISHSPLRSSNWMKWPRPSWVPANPSWRRPPWPNTLVIPNLAKSLPS